MAFAEFYRGRRVLVTGSTGFKGAWLGFWLARLGAQVVGLALEPETEPSLFEVLDLAADLRQEIVDVRDRHGVNRLVAEVRPEVVFHLAAQALVRRSYELPLETVDTNVMGSLNLLQALRAMGCSQQQPCSVVVVTSDKCYENPDDARAHHEDDPLGGHDPYSASKGAAEVLVRSWRRSFFPPQRWSSHGVSLATVRAGNVIGGGDWAVDRIVPDCMRALAAGDPVAVRNPGAVRPWQHVLEPLSGYLHLAAEMAAAQGSRSELMSAFNFGPGEGAERTVGQLVNEVLRHWQGTWQALPEPGAVAEAAYLRLATERASRRLGWRPVWSFEETVSRVVGWYRCAHEQGLDRAALRQLTETQIEDYTAAARATGLGWASGSGPP